MTKPHLRKINARTWQCSDGVVTRNGMSGAQAYGRWKGETDRIAAAEARKVKPPKPEPYQPHQVIQVPGTLQRPSLNLPAAFRINAARALAAQPRTRSVSSSVTNWGGGERE